MHDDKTTPDDLPELPPLDDDGSVLGGDEDLVPDHDLSEQGLDDATSEDEPLDRFGGFDGIDDEGALVDLEEAHDLVVDGERDLLAGAEVGLLEDSDEGDGKDGGHDGLVGDDDEGSAEDGGAEGTDEDPAAVLEADADGAQASVAADDEGIDDDARFADPNDRTSGLNEGREREPWPPRADVAWSCTRVDLPKAFAGIETVTSAGGIVGAVDAGALQISTDGGGSFARVGGCQGVTAITIVSSAKPQRAVAAALHDPSRESTAIVLVRIDDAGSLAAELVADFVAEDDESSPVDTLLARVTREGALELLARSGAVVRVLRRKA